MAPATEITRSDGADVAGIARYLRARTPAPLKLRPYGAIQICLLLLLLLLRQAKPTETNDALGWFLSPGYRASNK